MWKMRSGCRCEVRGTQEQIWALVPGLYTHSWNLGASHQGARDSPAIAQKPQAEKNAKDRNPYPVTDISAVNISQQIAAPVSTSIFRRLNRTR